jgi:pimeloyl-ACP methyl ester carboxylesterase
MADFILVPGAWHGAWCWKRVLAPLWERGHRAFALTLTGVGERAHVDPCTVTLETHIADVTGVLEAEELNDAVLVGHSYGGVVVTGAAARMPARVGHLVFVDAVVPLPGESWSSSHAPEVRDVRRAAIRAHGVLPPPDPSVYGLAGDDAAWVARRQTPQPGLVYDAPLAFDPRVLTGIGKTFVDCTHPPLATIDASRRRARELAGFAVVQIPTGHDPMISAPQALLAVLDAVARTAAQRTV